MKNWLYRSLFGCTEHGPIIYISYICLPSADDMVAHKRQLSLSPRRFQAGWPWAVPRRWPSVWG